MREPLIEGTTGRLLLVRSDIRRICFCRFRFWARGIIVNSCRYKASDANTSMSGLGPDILMVISGEVQTLPELSPSRPRNPRFESALFMPLAYYV